MKLEQFVQSLLLTGSVFALISIPARGEKISKINVQSFPPTETDSGKSLPVLSKTQLVQPTREIRRVSEIPRPLTNAQMLVQSPTPANPPNLGGKQGGEIVQVTGVKANPTEKGVEVILQTSKGQQLQLVNRSTGNNFITDIPNAQLRLPRGDTFVFRSKNPIAGVTEITVTNFDANTIRVTVTGEARVPIVELFDSPKEGLIFSVATAASSAQQPQAEQKPEQVQSGSETQSAKPSATGDEPIELVVTGEQDRYNPANATTATRTDTPRRDIPQSIQVIPRQVIEDQQVIQLDEALRNVSGVITGGFDTNTEARYSIRGFDNAPILIDGFRQYGFPEVPEIANLERVEVLKGPASILFGEIQPGGVINAVTKKPLSKPFYQAEFQAGTDGLIRPRIDISGPVTTDGNVLYRLNALYQSSDSFRDFDQKFERFFIAPVVSWNISDRTNITFELQYLNRERPQDNGTVAFGTGIADIPRNRILNEPDDYVERTFINTGYSLEHRFSNNWTLRNAFRYTTSSLFSDKLSIATAFNPATNILNRVYALDDFDSKDYSLQTNVVGKFATGPVKHTLLFGVDLNRNNSSTFVRANFSNPAPINIFNPVYRRGSRTPLATLFVDRESETNRLGVYLQDQIDLLDNLKLLAGLRYETLDQKITNEPAFTNRTGRDYTQSPDAWTPRVGLVYQPIQEVSFYGSYSKSFTPSNNTFTIAGNPLEPERGEGYEVGIKAELLNSKLLATVAYFDITKQNVASGDPNFPGLGASVATGEQKSSGVEFDVSGEILPGWNIIASYAYIDGEITRDTNRNRVGNAFVGIPKHSASLWTTYEIQRGNLQGLGFGVGFNYVGNREGDLDNSYRLGSYFLTNAALFYRRDNWRVALNFKNLFDIDYITGTPFSRVSGIYPGDPLTVIGSISIQF